MRLVIVGDTNIQERAEPVSAFSRVKSILGAADVLLGHAEGMFTEAARNKDVPSLPYKDRWRHSTPEMMYAFREANFHALSLASNVSADANAVAETISVASNVGIAICGIGLTMDEARKPAFIQHEDTEIALLSRTSVFWPPVVPATATEAGAATVRAYTAYQPGRRALEMPGAPPVICTWPDEEELSLLIEDIRVAKQRARCVILSMHWGVSGSSDVLDYQRSVARTAIDAGVSLVFGHHPHVVSSLEVYKGAPIFYSLGNFAFDWEKARNRILDGITLNVEWREESIKSVKIAPVRRGEDNLIGELPVGSPIAANVKRFLIETAILEKGSELREDGNQLLLSMADRKD